MWDEVWLYARLSEDVRLAVESSPEYSAAEAALLDCVNSTILGGDGYSSFADILNDYDQITEAAVGECEGRQTNPTTMFQTVQRQSAIELSKLAAANPMYATLLRAPRGMDFANSLGSPHQTKLLASLQAGSN